MSINSPLRASNKLIDARYLIELFNTTFYPSANTRLEGGGFEPEYRPADLVNSFNRIIFSHDYVASALHEIAHWCVAGKERRMLPDYGYWYEPDGRSSEKQAEFEHVEVKPQALEWIFSTACQIPFRVSADNLETGAQASDTFKAAIVEQALQYCAQGLNSRAQQWLDCLSNSTGTYDVLNAEHYSVEQLS